MWYGLAIVAGLAGLLCGIGLGLLWYAKVGIELILTVSEWVERRFKLWTD